MADPNQLVDLVKALGGSLLAVSVAALSAPVTGNRLQLWRLERLNNVIDKTPVEDPARPYLEAEARKISTWWSATHSTRLSLAARTLVIFELWLVVVAVMSIIWPAPEAQMGYFPLVSRWFTVPMGAFALLRLLMAVRRRRVDRVRFYNVLIESGPDEFKISLKKRYRVPAFFGDLSEDEALERPGPRATGHHLEAEKIRTCPNGHAVTGGNLYLSDYDFDNDPPRNLLCGRCGVPLPRPLTRDVDEDEASFVAAVRHRRRKEEEKAAAAERATAETAETEQVATENDPASPGASNLEGR